MEHKKILKNHKIKRYISALMCCFIMFLSLFSSCDIPVYAVGAVSSVGTNVIKSVIDKGSYNVGSAIGSSIGGPVGGLIGGEIVKQSLNYFLYPSKSGTDNKYNYYINNGTTNNYNQTNNYKVFNDYSSNPIINNNQSYNYSFYNPITSTYNYTNNVYYNNDYSTYYYNVSNVNNNSVDYYITDNTTYVSYYIVDNETSEEWYYEIYYELPDGRNSYDLTKDDIWGTYFIYDYDKYEAVAEDDGKTLGLWHLDGNLKDSSYWHNADGSAYTTTYVDGTFDGGKKLGTSTSDYISLKLDKVSLPDTFTLEWIEYIPDISETKKTTNEHSPYADSITDGYYYSRDYLSTTQRYRGVTGLDGFYRESPRGGFVYQALVKNGSNYSLYTNGVLNDDSSTYDGGGLSITSNEIIFKVENKLVADSGWGSYSDYKWYNFDYNTYKSYYERERYRAKIYTFCNYNCIIDEVRLSKGALYNSDYSISTQPFITNTVLVPPENPKENDVAFKTNYDISNVRIGGAKPTFPNNGYVYVYLENDVVKSIQQYQSTGWYEIDGSIYIDDEWKKLNNMDLRHLKVEKPPESSPPDNPDNPDKPDISGNSPSGSDVDGDGILSLIKGFFKLVFSLITSVFQGIIDLFNLALEAIGSLGNVLGEFSGFLSGLFSFVPADLWKVIISGMTLIVTISVIKFIRG